jgi:hypothetical protein
MPHLSTHDVSIIDLEVRDVLAESAMAADKAQRLTLILSIN